MSETYYEVLDVAPDASTEEIRDAYRAKVKETHPDVSDASDAGERFQQVKRAKEILTDEGERERYDRLGHDTYVEGVVNPGVGDPSDGDAAAGPDREGPDGSESNASGTTRSKSGTERSTSSQSGSSRSGTARANASATADAGSGTAAGASDWRVSDADAGTRAGEEAAQEQRQRTRRTTSGYATRTSSSHTSFDGLRVPLTARTAITMVSTFVLYPVFVFSSVLPQFPLSVNLVLGLCTLFVIAYLISMPEVAIVVFGAWSVLAPLLMLSTGWLSLVSLVGVVALLASWFPLGLALLARSALRV